MADWLNQAEPPKIKKITGKRKTNLPEGLWKKCPNCDAVLYSSDLEKNFRVCPQCDFHLRLNARQRIDLLLDANSSEEIFGNILPKDILKFKDSKTYSERLNSAKKATKETDSLIVVKGNLHKQPVILSVFEFEFMGGSMGSVLGERFVRGIQTAVKEKIPFISVTASGGARMQEGLFSLMQMAKTSAALNYLSQAKIPFISVLTDPTMGGVSASFAFVGDIVIAEPGALIGFAGPRVIEQTVRETLPKGFQRSEFILEKGAIDLICHRHQLKDKIAKLLRFFKYK